MKPTITQYVLNTYKTLDYLSVWVRPMLLWLLQLLRPAHTHPTGYRVCVAVIVHVLLLGTGPLDQRLW